MTWFSKGQEGEQFFKEEQERKKKEAEQRREVKNYRFFMQKGADKQIVFLSPVDFFFKEHQFKKGDNFFNWETCIMDIEKECPLCENDNRPALVSAATIIDLTGYTKKDGTKVTAVKVPVVFKQGNTERILKKQQKQGGDLTGKVFEVYRSTDAKAEATGTDFEFSKDVDWEKLKQLAPENTDPDEWIQPFDLAEVFKPKSASEIRAILGFGDPVGSSPDEAPDPSDGSESGNDLSDLV